MIHLFIDILRNSILITGLVVVMMMMIESLNIESRGMVFRGLRRTKLGQVVIGALLGSVPGCMGGFATVSLYTHKLFSFGALVAMMIASSGDEAFVMLAMIPEQTLVLFAVLFVLAVVVGVVTDMVHDRVHKKHCDKNEHSECGVETECGEGYEIHEADGGCCDSGSHSHQHSSQGGKRHLGWKRITMFIGLAAFIAALATGNLGHDHGAHNGEGHQHSELCTEEHCEHSHTLPAAAHNHESTEHQHNATESHIHTDEAAVNSFQIDLLSEDWMNVLFAGLSVIVLFVLIFASDHFVEEHLWNHIIKKHLLTIFGWTFGVLLVLGIGLQYIDISSWISDNTVLMILLATAIGIIPESGPHLIFVTLFAAGMVPFPVLLASSISQDGHASIPLLAESRRSFLWAKLINCAVAILAGFGAMLLM